MIHYQYVATAGVEMQVSVRTEEKRRVQRSGGSAKQLAIQAALGVK